MTDLCTCTSGKNVWYIFISCLTTFLHRFLWISITAIANNDLVFTFLCDVGRKQCFPPWHNTLEFIYRGFRFDHKFSGIVAIIVGVVSLDLRFSACTGAEVGFPLTVITLGKRLTYIT